MTPPVLSVRLALCSVMALASCAGTPLGTAAILEFCERQPDRPTALQHQARVVIESPQFNGEFTGVAVVRASPLAVRLQLFPDVGGKILDVAATKTWQRGVIPLQETALDYPTSPGGDRLLQMFATSLLETYGQLDAERVIRAYAPAIGGIRLDLEPRYGASSCTLRVNSAGTQRAFDLVRRGVGWQLRVDQGGNVDIEAKNFKLTAVIETTEKLDEVPDDVFQLGTQ